MQTIPISQSIFTFRLHEGSIHDVSHTNPRLCNNIRHLQSETALSQERPVGTDIGSGLTMSNCMAGIDKMDSIASSKIGFFGISIGAIGLLLALYHFWAGPFSPQPTLEDIVAEKAVTIKEKVISRLSNKELAPTVAQPSLDKDAKIHLATSILGGLAIILGVVGVAIKNPLRVAGSAIFLGAFTIAFQFAIFAIGVVVMAILIAAVIHKLEFDFFDF